MRLTIYLASLFLVGLLLGNPNQAVADDPFLRPMNPANNMTEENIGEFPSAGSTQQRSLTEPSEMVPADSFEVVAVDYCYRGSIFDPATGEMVDIFVMCSEGEIGRDLDVA